MNTPRWFEGSRVKKKSQKKERQRASELGGKTQPGSGAQWHAKGDIKLENYLIEHKYTDKKGYTLTNEIFLKVEKEALSIAKIPLMLIEIQNKKYIVQRYEDL